MYTKVSSPFLFLLIALPFGGAADILTTADLNAEDEEEDAPIYAKKDAQLYGKQSNKKDKFVSMQFMKKYIHLAKAIKVWLHEFVCYCFFLFDGDV